MFELGLTLVSLSWERDPCRNFSQVSAKSSAQSVVRPSGALPTPRGKAPLRETEGAMFGLAASSVIAPDIPKPLARACRDNVAKRFGAGKPSHFTARSSKQAALDSVALGFTRGTRALSPALRCDAELRPCCAGMLSCCAVPSRSRAIRARPWWQRRGPQTAQWCEEELRQEGWRPLGTFQDASDPDHGEAPSKP